MEFRQLGGSGLKVPVLSFGTAGFGGKGEFFQGFGETQVDEARRLVDICLEAGVNMFDSADTYSRGVSEEILGQAIKGRRDEVVVATKFGFTTGIGAEKRPIDGSPAYVREACEASLERLGIDCIDLYYLHRVDASVPIEDTEDAGVEKVLELNGGKGADRGCECVGYQCCGMHREEVPNLTMNNLVQTVKATGGIGVVGVFVPEDPGAKDRLEKRGAMDFDFGSFWFKGQSVGTGQANVKAYNRFLSRLIERDKAKPSLLVSHELPLEQAPEGYKNFDERKKGWTKVVLKPGKSGRS